MSDIRETPEHSDVPREFTVEEVRTMFLKQVRAYIEYWSGDNVPSERTWRERMEGLAFSLLVTLDGGTELPAFIVAPSPHPDDRLFRQGQGENWWPENLEGTVNADIAGCLHELFHTVSAD